MIIMRKVRTTAIPTEIPIIPPIRKLVDLGLFNSFDVFVAVAEDLVVGIL